jgi:hypothetical protein
MNDRKWNERPSPDGFDSERMPRPTDDSETRVVEQSPQAGCSLPPIVLLLVVVLRPRPFAGGTSETPAA